MKKNSMQPKFQMGQVVKHASETTETSAVFRLSPSHDMVVIGVGQMTQATYVENIYLVSFITNYGVQRQYLGESELIALQSKD